MIMNCRTLGRSILAAGVLATALGCSPVDVQESPVFERVALEFEGEGPVLPESLPIRTWSSFGEGKDQSDWDIQADSSGLEKRGKDTVLEIVHSTKVATLQVPVIFEMGRAVALTIRAEDAADGVIISAALYAGETVVASSKERFKSNSTGKGCQMVLTHVPGAPTNVDRLVLRLTKGAEPLLLRSMSLRTVPLGLSLGPKPFSGATLVEIGGDARRARALPTGENFRGRLFVEGETDVLRFTYGQTALTMTAGQVPEISVQLNERGAQPSDATEATFGFVTGKEAEPGWLDAELPLGQWAGKELEVNFSLHADGATGVCLLGEPRRSSLEVLPKTIVFVTSDTHRSDHLGFLMPDGSLKTDALDKLAAQGVTFLDALSSVNNTTPSHVSLMTGLSPRDTGLIVNAKHLAEEAPTLAEAFRELGYATLASVSATPVDHKLSNLGQGFDRYAVPLGISVHDAEDALGHIHNWLVDYEGEPVFVWVHIYDAHGPYDAPDPFKTQYYEGDRDPFDSKGPGANPKLAPYWDKSIADPVYTESLYKGEITYLDNELGKLFDLPRVQNGIVAVTADHGEVLRYGPGEPFDHRGLSLSTLAVPLILKAPGIAPGTQRTEPVSHLNIGRTWRASPRRSFRVRT